jgi:hypothetical protein
MAKQKSTSKYEIHVGASFTRLIRHLPKAQTDFSLLVLKGHLLVEEEINDFLAVHWRNPAAVKKLRLTFFERMSILRALLEPGRNDKAMWEAIDTLNSLRNALAHHLASPKVQALVDDFNKRMVKFNKHTPEIEEPERFRTSIAMLCAALVGRREVFTEGRTPGSGPLIK